jgi:hypothetical protein
MTVPIGDRIKTAAVEHIPMSFIVSSVVGADETTLRLQSRQSVFYQTTTSVSARTVAAFRIITPLAHLAARWLQDRDEAVAQRQGEAVADCGGRYADARDGVADARGVTGGGAGRTGR